jgi:hypothetical protein
MMKSMHFNLSITEMCRTFRSVRFCRIRWSVFQFHQSSCDTWRVLNWKGKSVIDLPDPFFQAHPPWMVLIFRSVQARILPIYRKRNEEKGNMLSMDLRCNECQKSIVYLAIYRKVEGAPHLSLSESVSMLLSPLLRIHKQENPTVPMKMCEVNDELVILIIVLAAHV